MFLKKYSNLIERKIVHPKRVFGVVELKHLCRFVQHFSAYKKVCFVCELEILIKFSSKPKRFIGRISCVLVFLILICIFQMHNS